jgi:uncharacterized membrane protein
MTQLTPQYDYPIEDRRLAAACYIFAIPALYCILTARRYTRFVGGHAAQAFLLWLIIVAYWLIVRIAFNIVWWLFSLIGFFFPYISFLAFGLCFAGWVYAIKFGMEAYKGNIFQIDLVGKIGSLIIWKKG